MVGRPGGPRPVCGFLNATRAAPWDRAASWLPDDESMRSRAADRVPSALGSCTFKRLLVSQSAGRLVAAVATSRASTAGTRYRTDGVALPLSLDDATRPGSEASAIGLQAEQAASLH